MVLLKKDRKIRKPQVVFLFAVLLLMSVYAALIILPEEKKTVFKLLHEYCLNRKIVVKHFSAIFF